MKLNTTLNLTALAAAISLSSAAFAQDNLPAASTGGSTGASFTGGLSTDGGTGFGSTATPSDTVSFIGTITPDPADVGSQADIFIAAKIGNKFFQYDGTSFVNLNVADLLTLSLMPAETVTLGATQEIEIADVEAALGTSINGAGQVKIYIAYSPAGSSNLVYGGKAAKVTVASPASASCPAGTTFLAAPGGSAKDFCVLSGTYTEDLHLTNNFDYIFSGSVRIGMDNTVSPTLTIDPGITTYGESGNDFLWIDRGAKIMANGTRFAPITMTSATDADATPTTRGEWGGLVINGNAPINGCTEGICEAAGEGNSGLFGGDDPEDSSGSLTYLVVKYAGFLINDLDELNGIAFQGVGSGTHVDYVQVHNNQDDGVEFFGGTVNAKHLYLTGNRDDSLDWTFGWTGKVQHVLIVQGEDTGDRGHEMDNNGDAPDSLPRAQPVISNATIIGNFNTGTGMTIREGTGANFSNYVVVGSGGGCIDIDTTETFTAAGSSATDLTGTLTMTNSVVDCDTNFVDDAGEPWTVADWFLGQDGNEELETGMSPSRYRNTSAVNAVTPATQTDPFFDQTDYIGAVKNAAEDWTSGWTFKP